MALARSETVVADNLGDRATADRHWNATAGENNSAKPWRDWFVLFAFGTACRMARCHRLALSIVSRPMISRASGRLAGAWGMCHFKGLRALRSVAISSPTAQSRNRLLNRVGANSV